MEIRTRKSHKKKYILFFFLFVCIVSASIVSYRSLNKPKSPLPPTDVLAEATQITGEPEKVSLLPQIIQGELVGTKGSYGIVVVNLHTGERYLANEHRVYKSASLYKLWIMGTVFEQIQEGKLSETTVLTESLAGLNKKFGLAVADPTQSPDAAPADATPTPEQMVSYTVGDALEQMITISDNNAALLLTSRVGLSNVAGFLKKYDFAQSRLGANNGYPVTTPADIALFFIKLYKGDLVSQGYSEKMLSLLKRQRLNGKLPKYLPEEIIMAHKTGELDEFTHDAGIVFGPNGEYLIVVLSESDSRLQAEERIANVSRAVYNYFLQ